MRVFPRVFIFTIVCTREDSENKTHIESVINQCRPPLRGVS